MPNENEPILEAILQNQDENASETNDLLEKVLEQTADNNTEDLLEKQLLKLDEISNKEDVLKIEINGAESVMYKGEKGDVGPEPSDDRLKQLIKPLIPQVRDGKDADMDTIVDKVLEVIVPEIPSVEDIVAQIPKPKDGLRGRDGLDADENRIIKRVLSQIPEALPGEKGLDGSPDTPEQVKEKLLTVGLKYDELSDKPDIDKLLDAVNRKQSSKTVSLRELDDVDLSGATVTNGKYVIGGGAVDSVNSQTGVVVLDADDIDDTSTTQKFVTASDLTNLGNLSGTNTGDQTSIVGITGTTAQFNTALSDGDFATLAGTETLTNKRITKRIGTEASSATSTPTADSVDQWNVTALAVADAFAAPTGTPTDGQSLVIRIKDNGTARALTWNAIYRGSSDLALPTTTVLSKTMYLGFRYNSADSKWDLLALMNNI